MSFFNFKKENENTKSTNEIKRDEIQSKSIKPEISIPVPYPSKVIDFNMFLKKKNSKIK